MYLCHTFKKNLTERASFKGGITHGKSIEEARIYRLFGECGTAGVNTPLLAGWGTTCFYCPAAICWSAGSEGNFWRPNFKVAAASSIFPIF